MYKTSLFAMAAMICLLSGCASTGTTRSGSFTKAFVPPPPFGGSSSTITVVPAKTTKRSSSEKSWGTGETPGGAQSNATGQRSVAPQLASSREVRSLYELKNADQDARQSLPQTARPATKISPPSTKGGNPVPVLYEQGNPEAPSTGEQREAPPVETTQDDPRRFT